MWALAAGERSWGGARPTGRRAVATESRPNLKLQTEPKAGIDYDARRRLVLGVHPLARRGDHDVNDTFERECARCHDMRLRDCGQRNDGCGDRCANRNDRCSERDQCRNGRDDRCTERRECRYHREASAHAGCSALPAGSAEPDVADGHVQAVRRFWPLTCASDSHARSPPDSSATGPISSISAPVTRIAVAPLATAPMFLQRFSRAIAGAIAALSHTLAACFERPRGRQWARACPRDSGGPSA